MKKVYANEKWCLGCRLCEYVCAFANSGVNDMPTAFKLHNPVSRIRVEETDGVTYAVNCRHCDAAICLKSCISGAISRDADGVIKIDDKKCVGCHTCVLVCPFGAIAVDKAKPVLKCELCTRTGETPQCVLHCPNNALVFRGEEDMK